MGERFVTVMKRAGKLPGAGLVSPGTLPSSRPSPRTLALEVGRDRRACTPRVVDVVDSRDADLDALVTEKMYEMLDCALAIVSRPRSGIGHVFSGNACSKSDLAGGLRSGGVP